MNSCIIFTRCESSYKFKRPVYSLKNTEKSLEKILELITKDNKISAKQMAEKLGISSRAVEKNIAKLKASGKLKRMGLAKGGHWEVIK